MASGRFVAYYRVSTGKQGKSGLGLDAQREAVTRYLNGGDWTLVAEFVEVESGKRSDRPQLAAALDRCRLTGATLCVAKLDRLSRNVAFLSALMDAGVEFVAVDNATATRFTLHILAAVAEHEAAMISQRTTAALAAAKARGVTLGGWHGGPVVDHRLATAARVAKSDAFASRVGPMVVAMRRDGLSLRTIAERLTADGVQTANGGQWSAMTVRNILQRVGA